MEGSEMIHLYQESTDLQSITLEKIRIAISQKIEPLGVKGLELHIRQDYITDSFVLQFTALSTGKKTEKTSEEYKTVQCPFDWWESVKERFFPTWLLKRFPVQYKSETFKIYSSTTQIINTCPHQDLPKHDFAHFQFLASQYIRQ